MTKVRRCDVCGGYCTADKAARLSMRGFETNLDIYGYVICLKCQDAISRVLDSRKKHGV